MTSERAPAAAATTSFALTSPQLSFWLYEQFGDRTANVVPMCVRLFGPLDTAALEAAFRCVVARHDALRSRIVDGAHGPLQIVEPELDVHIPLESLQALTDDARERALLEALEREARRPFELQSAPLFRVVLYRLSPELHVLLFVVHHLIFDGWSVSVLLAELGELYGRARRGQALEGALPAPVQFGQIAAWLGRRAAGDRRARELEFWRAELAGCEAALTLESSDADGRPLASGQALPRFALRQDVARRLPDFCRQRGVTPFMTLAAALAIVLHRHTGRTRFTIGSPFAMRWDPRTSSAIGCLVSTLPICIELEAQLPFSELLARVQRSCRRAMPRLELGFHELVAEVNPPRVSGQNPVFDVMLNLLGTPAPPFQLDELRAEPFEALPIASRFALTLYVQAREPTLAGWASYRPDRMSAAYVQGLLAQLAEVIDRALAQPDAAIDSYELAPCSGETPVDQLPAPSYEPIAETIAGVARTLPDALAVQQAGVSWSYAELESTACAIARALLATGARVGDVVAVEGTRSFGLVASLLGVLKAGCAVMPIDAALPPKRVEAMFDSSGAQRMLRVGVAPSAAARPCAHVLEVDARSGRVATPVPGRPVERPRVQGSDRAYVFFTSGTTGTPKGVAGTHAGLSHFLHWQRETFGVGPGDRSAQLTGLSFDVVLRDVFLPLVSGATLCLPPAAALEGDAVLAWLHDERISLWHAVPTLARAWLAQPGPERLPSMRCVFFAGEPLHASVVGTVRARMPGAQVVNLYGPTETTLAKCFYVVPHPPVPGVQPVGHALPNTDVSVMHEGRRRCAPGEIGEVVIRTPFATRGYLNATAGDGTRGFVLDAAGQRMYRTGDRGRLRADGVLELLGRFDDQIKIRGCRVEPEEVAACLREDPRIRDAAVRYQRLGDDGRLIAYVVPASGGTLSWEELAERLVDRVPSFMVPSELVVLPALPRNASGKLDASRLPAPAPRASASDAAALPMSELERRLAELWQRTLDVDFVGASDNFFDLGGNSLLFRQMQPALRELLGRDISIADLFRWPTVRVLARGGAQRGAAQAPAMNEDALGRRREALELQRMARERHRKLRSAP